jgi:DNA processing protein
LRIDAGGITLTDGERLAWLRLSRSENVGPATFRELVTHFGSAGAALEALPGLSRRGGAVRPVRIASQREAEEEIEQTERVGGRFIGMGEPLYPPWLRHGDAPPPLVSVRGDPQHLTRPAIAIVGARNASVAGRKMAALLAKALGEAEFVIVSGLARGIDSAAHEAALGGGTVAVFAGGIDRIYPAENEMLFGRISDAGGCGISEMRFGWEPRARDFPRRNRIIAGMTLATIVVEAAERSGSLITARMALEQNREVFAVPGSPLDPRAAGSNSLLKQGARLVTDAADVIEALLPILGREAKGPTHLRAPASGGEEAEPAESDRSRVLEALGPTPVEVDEIIRFTSLPARTVLVVLLELDLAGRVERHPGQRVSLK